MSTEILEQTPYVGPRPFEQEDRELFFGRDREIGDVVSLITGYRTLLVYAQSGAGKTSLIQAGLIPRLEEEGFEVFPVTRVQGRIPIDIVPEQVPNLYVLNALISWSEAETEARLLLGLSLADYLKSRPHPTDEFGFSTARVIIFDQFEELLTFYPERWKDRDDFFRQVDEALEEDPLLRVVFVIREEYVARLDAYAYLLHTRLRTRFRLERLTERQAMLAVKEPLAMLAGRRWTFGEGVAENLVKELLQTRAINALGESVDIQGQYVEPVQLQVVCWELWSRLSRESGEPTVISQRHIQEFGDVNGALTNFYEGAIQAVVRDQGVDEGHLRGLFDRELITPMKTRGTVLRGEHSTEGISNEAIDELEDRHLIRAELRGGAHWYELTHDRFIEPILVANEAWREARETPLTHAARYWDLLERDEGGLLRGAALDEAAKWAEGHPTELGKLESDFLEESRALRQREAEEKERQREHELEQTRELAAARARASRRLRIALALVCVLVVAVAVFAWLQRRQATSRAVAMAALNQLEFDPELSLLLARQGASKIYDVDKYTTGEAEAALHQALYAPMPQRTITGTHEFLSAALSPDGRWLAAASADGKAKVWALGETSDYAQPDELARHLGIAKVQIPEKTRDVGSLGEPLTFSGHISPVLDVAFSSDSTLLATASEDGTAKIWEMDSGREVFALRGHVGAVQGVAFGPDRTYLATAGADGKVKVWDAESGKLERTLFGHLGLVYSVAFSPDGEYLASAGVDRMVKVWNVSPGTLERTLDGHRNPIRDLAFDPAGQPPAVDRLDGDSRTGDGRGQILLVTASNDGTAKVWDVVSGKEIRTLLGHGGRVSSVAFSRDGKRLATASIDGTAKVWNVSSGQELATLYGHARAIHSIAFHPDGERVATASADGTVKVWVIVPGQELLFLPDQRHPVYGVAYSADGALLAAAGADGTVNVMDADSGTVTDKLSGDPDAIWDIAFDLRPSSGSLAVASANGRAWIWDIASGTLTPTLPGHAAPILGVAFSSDGVRLATASADKTAKVWDVATGRELRLPLEGHTDAVWGVAFHPRDEALLATASADKTARLWNVVSGDELLALGGHNGTVYGVAFSPDGRLLATASADGTVKVWNSDVTATAGKGEELLTLAGRAGEICGVTFSPDGKRLAAATAAGGTQVWDVAFGQELFAFSGPGQAIRDVAFSPDGTRLAIGSEDGTVGVYVLDVRELRDLAQQRVTRSLTPSECRQHLHKSSCP